MKTIKYIVLGMLLSSVFVITSCTELYQDDQTQATGDNADDPVGPGENRNSPATAYPFATGDNADDPVPPGGN